MTTPPELREVLNVLGSGGTTEMARRVKTWSDARRSPVTYPGIPPQNLLGLAEVSALTGVPETTINTWADFRQVGFPPPAAVLSATRIWDRDQVDVWMRGHPDLVGERGA